MYLCVCFFFFQGDLVTCGVLSGNRNFEGRLCDCVRANYLASPPLVVAYAIAGTVDIDFQTEPLGSIFLARELAHLRTGVVSVTQLLYVKGFLDYRSSNRLRKPCPRV